MVQHKSLISDLRLWWVLAIALVLFKVVLETMWFRPLGDTLTYLTDKAFANPQASLHWSKIPLTANIDLRATDAASSTVASAPNVAGHLPLDAVVVDIWFLPHPETFDAEHIFARRLEREQTADGSLTYYIEFTEEGLNQYLHYWFGDGTEVDPRLQNVWFDLQPGGLIVYADVNVVGDWQRIGAVFNLAADGRQFVFAGVDIKGQLFGAPPAGPIAEVISALEAQGNRALHELKFIDPAGDLFLQQIVITEDGAQILAQ